MKDAENNISLRALELDDCEQVYLWENDLQAWNVGITDRFLSRWAVEQYIISEQNEDIFSARQARFVVECNRESVGCVDIYDLDVRNQRAFVAVYIDRNFRNRGFGAMAVKLLEDYSFDTLHLHQLAAYVSESNIYSQQLFETRGFQQTCLMKEWQRTTAGYENVKLYQKILQ